MSSWPVLSLITFLPIVGTVLILMLRGDPVAVARNARYLALWTSLITFLVSLVLWFGFDRSSAEFQFMEQADWIPAFGIHYKMGVDGISMLFVLLSTLLTPICILSAWEAIKVRVKEYMIAFLVLETLMVGTFCALDFVLFYMFFEGVLIPMFLIIGVWGGERRVYSAFKFFLYTLLGSVLMMLGSVLMMLVLIAMYYFAGTTDIPTLMHHGFPVEMQRWLWLGLLASFAVKVPMWPVHTWLPDAHVEAPTAGSVILAGVLLKLGAYGFLRFSVPMLPQASAYFTPLIFVLSAVAVVYTSLVALAQEDMKKTIAYSSVAHMGFVTAGIFTATVQGVQGAVFQMLSHGLVSSGLFLIVGVVYDRLHTHVIDRFGGLVNRMPIYAAVFMLLMLASVGLPGTSGFIGEFLSMLGAFQVNTWLAFFLCTGIILGASYMLWLYRRIIFGKLEKADLMNFLDLSPREVALFVPLGLLILWMGVYPTSFIEIMAPSVDKMLGSYHTALALGGSPHLASLATQVTP